MTKITPKETICFLLFFFLPIYLYGLDNNFVVSKYSMKDGLSSANINCIIQDYKGFLWVGTTNGLNRFDGTKFVVYKNDPNDSSSITNNQIQYLLEDSRRNLWIATINGGVSRYNRKLDNFINFKFNYNDTNSVFPGRIWGIFEDNKGLIYFVLDGKICRYNYKTNKFEKRIFSTNTLETIQRSGPKLAFQDKENKYWLCTWTGGILRLNSLLELEKKYIAPNQITDQSINCFFIDKTNNYWFGTWSNGLLKYDKSNDQFISYKNIQGNEIAIKNNKINAITQDLFGNYWIGSHSGISKLNFINNQPVFKNYFNDKTLGIDFVKSLYVDKSGVLWIGTNKDLVKYAPYKNKFQTLIYSPFDPENPNNISNNNITYAFEDSKGFCWFATWGGGINRLDLITNTIKQYKQNDKFNSISDNFTRYINEDKKGNLWIATRNSGICLYNLATEKFFVLPVLKEISTYHITNILFDKEQNVWIGTFDKGAYFLDIKLNKLIKLDSTFRYTGGEVHSISQNTSGDIFISNYSGLWQKYKNNYHQYWSSQISNDSIFISTNHIDNAYSDNNGFIWALSNRGYLNKINPNTKIVKQYRIYSNGIIEDKNKTLWIASSNGLHQYDEKKDSFITYTIEKGLPDNEIYSILEDKNGFLWLATAKGIVCFNPKNKQCDNFDINDGLHDYSFSKVKLKTKNGTLFFCSENGISYFNPEKIIKNPYTPNVVFTDFKIKNKSIKIGEKLSNKIILKRSITETNHVFLTYKENFFTIEYAALEFTNPTKIHYRYMLSGFDNNWITTTLNTVNYTNLHPGDYEFRIIASNNDGVWSEELSMLTITILPPFWATWWFRILVFILVVGSFGIFYYIRVITVQRQNRYLNEKVKLRTFEILEKNEELRVQNEHIEEQKKELEKLNATKDRLFSIIAHDLKNPFNAISGFASLLINNFDHYSNTQKIELIKLIDSSSHNAYELLENLLNWSRANLNAIKYKPIIFDLNKLICDSIEFLNIIAKNKSITIHYTEKHIHCFADIDMINTVIRNLLANALKFTPTEGNVWIDIIENENMITINIKDNGVGMDKNTIAKLFRVDQQHTTIGTEGEKGTGIGLILCKDFVDRNNGNIRVESELEKGSTFIVDLPKKE